MYIEFDEPDDFAHVGVYQSEWNFITHYKA